MDKIATYVACFWLFVVLDSFFIWNSLELMITAIAFVGVLITTIFIRRKYPMALDGIAFSAILSVGTFFLWMLFIYSGNLIGILFHFFGMIALIAIMTWPASLHDKIYFLFRKIIIFFATGSAIVSLITIIGLIQYVPYYELPPRSPLHEQLGIVYHVYLLFVTNYGDLEIFPRACGMLQEPGHFAIILGFVYMADRLLGKKVNLWIIICGFLTFSPNFPIVILITEFFNIFKIKNIIKILKGFAICIIGGVFLFSFLSKDMKEDLEYIAYGRNMEMVIDALMYSGSLTEALDERTSSSGDTAFQNINSSNMWVGLGHDETLITLSDYRGVILQYGVIGLVLILLAIISVTRYFPKRIQLQFLTFLILVLIQRSWMFYAPYLYFLTYMCSERYVAQTVEDDDEHEIAYKSVV